MDSAAAVLLRMEALLKRIEKHLRPEDESEACPNCGSQDLDEVPGVMGEDTPKVRCLKCHSILRLEAVNG